jgi:hypothetical protein
VNKTFPRIKGPHNVNGILPLHAFSQNYRHSKIKSSLRGQAGFAEGGAVQAGGVLAEALGALEGGQLAADDALSRS